MSVELANLKLEIAQMTCELTELKHVIEKLSTKMNAGVLADGVCVITALVGCMVGLLVANLLK